MGAQTGPSTCRDLRVDSIDLAARLPCQLLDWSQVCAVFQIRSRAAPRQRRTSAPLRRLLCCPANRTPSVALSVVPDFLSQSVIFADY